jgi:hypothetical protein
MALLNYWRMIDQMILNIEAGEWYVMWCNSQVVTGRSISRDAKHGVCSMMFTFQVKLLCCSSLTVRDISN